MVLLSFIEEIRPIFKTGKHYVDLLYWEACAYNELGHFERSNHISFEMKSLAEKFSGYNLSHALDSIANNFTKMGNPEEALKYRKMEIDANPMSEGYSYGISIYNMACDYNALRRPEESHPLLLRAFLIFSEPPFHEEIAQRLLKISRMRCRTFLELGRAALIQKDFGSSHEYLQKAKAEIEKNYDTFEDARLQYRFGLLFEAMEELDMAEESLRKSIALHKSLHKQNALHDGANIASFDKHLQRIFTVLVSVLIKKKQYEKALEVSSNSRGRGMIDFMQQKKKWTQKSELSFEEIKKICEKAKLSLVHYHLGDDEEPFIWVWVLNEHEKCSIHCQTHLLQNGH
jgi:tetratricopeptide (TPR) repeat protein